MLYIEGCVNNIFAKTRKLWFLLTVQGQTWSDGEYIMGL